MSCNPARKTTIIVPIVVQIFINMIESRATLGPASHIETFSIPTLFNSISTTPFGFASQGGRGVGNPICCSTKLIRPRWE